MFRSYLAPMKIIRRNNKVKSNSLIMNIKRSLMKRPTLMSRIKSFQITLDGSPPTNPDPLIQINHNRNKYIRKTRVFRVISNILLINRFKKLRKLNKTLQKNNLNSLNKKVTDIPIITRVIKNS